MSDFHYEGDTELLEKLQNYFAGKIVRKDLTKRIKEGDRKSILIMVTYCCISTLMSVIYVIVEQSQFLKLPLIRTLD